MKRYTQFISVLLIISLIIAFPVYASNEVTPWASAFFTSYDPSISYESGDTFEIWFDVVAPRRMQELGVSEIEIQVSPNGSNWTTTRTLYPEDYPQMICENTGLHAGYITYTGAIGAYYRAYITFYAKNSSGIGEIYAYTQTIRLVAAS